MVSGLLNELDIGGFALVEFVLVVVVYCTRVVCGCRFGLSLSGSWSLSDLLCADFVLGLCH